MSALFETSGFQSRRQALIDEITAAFDGVSREDGTTLHEAIALDDRQSTEEQRAARQLNQEKRWQEIPDNDIFACCSALSFLDEKGFRYYIPAFMVCGLKYWNDEMPASVILVSELLNSCEYHLLHDYPQSLRQSEPSSLAEKYQLTAAQCAAVARFLRFIADFDPQDAVTIQAVVKWEKFTGINPNI